MLWLHHVVFIALACFFGGPFGKNNSNINYTGLVFVIFWLLRNYENHETQAHDHLNFEQLIWAVIDSGTLHTLSKTFKNQLWVLSWDNARFLFPAGYPNKFCSWTKKRLETGRIMLPCSHWRRPPWHLLDTAKIAFQCLGMVDVSKDSPLDELYPQNFMVLAPFCNIHLYLPMLSTNDTWLISSCPHQLLVVPKIGGRFSFQIPIGHIQLTNPSSLGLWVQDGLQTSLLSMTNVVTFLPMACWVLHQLTHTHISCLTRDQKMLCCIVVGELILLMILMQMFSNVFSI